MEPPVLLLVEDDAGDALLFRELLDVDDLGYDLVVVTDVDDGLRCAASRDVAACMLDLGLPGYGDLEALEKFCADAPEVPVIVLTGRNDGTIVVGALSLGAQDFLVKGEETGRTIARSIQFSIERKRAERVAAELRLADHRSSEQRRLEAALLGRPAIRSGDVHWESRYVVARDGAVGGDFLDCVELDDGTLRLVVGDVAGHGSDEAALGIALRVAWRTLVLSNDATTDVLPDLERLFVSERNRTADFVTVCDVSVPPDRSVLFVRCAGHPPPLLGDGTRLSDAGLRPPLGIGGLQTPRSGTAHPLVAGSALFVYTDGLFELRRADGLVGGLDDLVEHMTERPDQGIDDLLASMRATAVGGWRDDVAIASLRLGPG